MKSRCTKYCLHVITHCSTYSSVWRIWQFNCRSNYFSLFENLKGYCCRMSKCHVQMFSYRQSPSLTFDNSFRQVLSLIHAVLVCSNKGCLRINDIALHWYDIGRGRGPFYLNTLYIGFACGVARLFVTLYSNIWHKECCELWCSLDI